MATALVFDIETGSQPWEQIERFFTAPDKPGDFDASTVKYGNAKAEDKRADILKKAQEKHAAEVAGWTATVEAAKAEFIDRAPLSATTGCVVAIGIRTIDKGCRVIDATVDEAKTLTDWWTLCKRLAESERRAVGHNIFGFDLPFMVRRSWLLGVTPPAWILEKGRYWHKMFSDTMTAWACSGRDMISLDNLSLAFGGQGKCKDDGAATGATFAKLFRSESQVQRLKAVEYLRRDLDMTWAIAERMALL